MIRIAKGDRAYCERFIQSLKDRVRENDRSVEDGVAAILRDVRDNGDRAVRAYSEKFDGWVPDSLEISMAEIERITADCDPAFLAAMERAAENIRAFHARQKQQSRIDPERNGVLMGQRVRGLHRVGVYVPGGTAAYPSSVLMNVIPAKIAEVGEIVMVTPPGRTGKPDKNILAAAKIAGVDRVFLIGGAQAVAALAYGTESVPKVDKVVGPGNIFVADGEKAALRHDRHRHDRRAERDPRDRRLEREARIPRGRPDEPGRARPHGLGDPHHAGRSARQGDGGRDRAPDGDAFAPRHHPRIDRQFRRDHRLRKPDGGRRLCERACAGAPRGLLREPARVHRKARQRPAPCSSGTTRPSRSAITLPAPNHVLPTSGTARFFSPLSVDDFIKKSSFIYYTKDALLAAADDIIRIAETEELTAHAK